MMDTPNCYTRGCVHFIGVSQPDGTEMSERVVCKAFPEGIPAAIAYGKNPHTAPFKGDHGILFEDKDKGARQA